MHSTIIYFSLFHLKTDADGYHEQALKADFLVENQKQKQKTYSN